MLAKYHEYNDGSQSYKGWYIQWYNNGEPFKWGNEVAKECGYWEYWDMLRDVQKLYGGFPTNGNLYFPTKEQAERAMEWIESLFIAKKLFGKVTKIS